MKNKQTSLESKIRLLVPNNLLRLFDKAIQGTFPSRNEAIRRGMQLVIEEIEQINAQNGKIHPVPTASNFQKETLLGVQAEMGGIDVD